MNSAAMVYSWICTPNIFESEQGKLSACEDFGKSASLDLILSGGAVFVTVPSPSPRLKLRFLEP